MRFKQFLKEDMIPNVSEKIISIDDIKIGDIFRCYETRETKAKFQSGYHSSPAYHYIMKCLKISAKSIRAKIIYPIDKNEDITIQKETWSDYERNAKNDHIKLALMNKTEFIKAINDNLKIANETQKEIYNKVLSEIK